MSGARAAMLARLGTAAPDPAHARALLDNMERPLTVSDPLKTFAGRLAEPAHGATLDHVGTPADVGAALTRYLDRHLLPREVFIPPALAAWDWTGIARLDRCPVDGGVAVALAEAAAAETATLLLGTGEGKPMLPDFLALHHVVILHADRLVAYLDQLPPPCLQSRATYWITGVSGTTDIEGQYVRGAHGPRFLHVILVGSSPLPCHQ